MTEDDARVVPLKREKCPTCRKLAQGAYLPFCSKRCADLDLGKWLNEDYRIASREEGAMDEDPDNEE